MKGFFMQFRFAAFSLSLLIALCSAGAQTQNAVWRIGEFDRSSAEFADGTPQQPVTYVIDRDHPGKAWSGFAPALFATTHSDPASAPRTIQFSLPAKPSSAYRLRVSLLIE